jgi:hypothetical protein
MAAGEIDSRFDSRLHKSDMFDFGCGHSALESISLLSPIVPLLRSRPTVLQSLVVKRTEQHPLISEHLHRKLRAIAEVILNGEDALRSVHPSLHPICILADLAVYFRSAVPWWS